MTVSAVGAVILLLMTVVNLRLGESVLYPPALFTLIWTALLGVSLVFTGSYFELSADSVSIFCVGAFAFSAGGALRLLLQERRDEHRPAIAPVSLPRAVDYLLAASLVILLFILPIFWNHILSIANPRFTNLWWGIRSGVIALSDTQGQKSWAQFFFDNVTVVSILLALTAVVHYSDRVSSRIVAVGLLVVACAFNFLTGSRSGVAMVLLGALGVSMMKHRGLSLKHMVAGAIGVFLMYAPITLLRAGSNSLLGAATQDLTVLGNTFLLYTVGPLAAFDAYLHSPATLPQTWSISYPFLWAASRMGFDVVAPSTHVGYMAVGPYGATNVYTMYFAYYPDYGWLGVVFLTAFVGYGTVWLYRVAAELEGYYLILYGLAFNEICKSGFNEGFFIGLNIWVKAGAYFLTLRIAQKIASASSMTPQPVQAHSAPYGG
ncbi:MAG: oligosaccharide repeat unit polymerase [Bryobacterales bacterium]|nr:oligosaccharide repeat unit polymerase [Bryobacterales bacterium]